MADYSVRFTARARGDLNAIRRWLLQPGSGLRANLKIARISQALAELQFKPDRWPAAPFPEFRQRVIEGHSIIYRIDSDAMEVTVMRVFGPYQARSAP